MIKVVKAIIRTTLLVGVLGVFYYGIYWYSGVWEIPLVGFISTLIMWVNFEVVEYIKEKKKEKDEEK